MKRTPSRCEVWRHRKTGHDYVVLGVAVPATNGREQDEVRVIYARHDVVVGMLFERVISEFMDGRFEYVTKLARVTI